TSAETATTESSRSRKTTSIGKRMKNVCTDPHGFSRSPSPSGKDVRPSNPFMRDQGLSASQQRSTSTSPDPFTSRVARTIQEGVRGATRGSPSRSAEITTIRRRRRALPAGRLTKEKPPEARSLGRLLKQNANPAAVKEGARGGTRGSPTF